MNFDKCIWFCKYLPKSRCCGKIGSIECLERVVVMFCNIMTYDNAL